MQTSQTIPAISAGVLAIFGGAFLGLYSCGGQQWHRQAIYVALALSATLATVYPPAFRGSSLARFAIPLAALALFLLAQAVSASFYPNPPATLGQFLSAFWLRLWQGPC